MPNPITLYTISSCPHCDAAREDLEWRGVEFVEVDVERDPEARARLLELTEGDRTVPVLAEEGKPLQIGWQGRGCAV
jgi:glutaredoxin 3